MKGPQKSAAAVGARRVLFVDDDVKFLETVRELMIALSAGHWAVLTAESASRAFALMQEQAVDLAVIDVQMNVMDGIQMLSLLNRGYPNVQKVVLTGHASEKYRAACLSNGAELFLEKPTSPDGWQSLHAVLNELIRVRPEEGFRGVLRRVGLQDVIQMECLARSSSVLEISNTRRTGQIFIDTGQIVHAQVGQAVGEEAFAQLMAFGGGQFNLRPFTEPPERTLSGQWEFLLMEAARRSDEARESGAPLMDEETSPEVAEGVKPPLSEDVQALLAKAASNPPLPQTAPVVPPGVRSRPRIDEMLVCSAQGEVLHEWQCPATEGWVSFFEFMSQRTRLLAQSLPLGKFDRLEAQSGGSRAIVLISAERGVLIKSRRELLS